MSDLNCVNLIDLSLEDDNSCRNKQKASNGCAQPFKENPLIPPSWQNPEDEENNPFDSVQNLVDRVDDPFDIVEKEASLKALHKYKLPIEVKLGNLLSLSDDNLLDEEQKPETPSLNKAELNTIKLEELDLESPPVMFHENRDSVSGTDTDSNPSSSTESSVSAKLKKNMEYRMRLLKLSISNAAYNSPIARRQSVEFEDILGTPVSSILSRAAEFGEHLLASESPLKLVEDEDLISEENPNFIDSEKNFEADLEMLKIPILNELASLAVEQISIESTESSVEDENKSSANLENTLTNMETIKAKLKTKKDEINDNHQQKISSLIQNLKTLISNGEMVDTIKKQIASDLLESLSSALKPINKENTLNKTSQIIEAAPHTIKRQNTFDMDLQETQICIDNQPLVQEMSTCMVNSSATYDGETSDEKQHLNLPEIDPLLSQTSPSQCGNRHNSNKDCENHLHNDVNDIVEQLGKLLNNNTADRPLSNNNPTFIVVMNSNQFNHSNLNSSNLNALDAKQRSAFVANYLENPINGGSPDLTKVNYMPRRRSQSLSLHDKVKIVKLPLQQPKPRSIQKQHGVQLDVSPPITTTPPSGDKEITEFKTPARIMRRNSYSSGTPFTAQIGVSRTGFRSESKNHTHIRRTQTLDTHHEGHQQAIVRPMSMPSKNLPTFKPDLKKKYKHSTESIIKSSGPLKATIPMKKVAPMLKTSPPTPQSNTKMKVLHNMSLQDQSRISKVPTTPLQAKDNSTLDVGVEYPNACSTPAAFTSPLKRTTGPINKPRYSYMSGTPNPRSSVNNSVSAASFKRRTISEYEIKSPLRPRLRSSAGSAAASSRVLAVTTRLSTSAGARISKTPVKKTSANTATIKPVTRNSSAGVRISKTPVKITTANTATAKPISRLRSCVSGGGLSARNKENTRP